MTNLTTSADDSTADLQRGLSQGNVCAFVGAGLSMGAGLPGWYELVSDLAQRIGYTDLPPRQWASSAALIDAAQVYINQRGLQSLIAFLKERLDTFNKTPTAAHRALAQLPIALLFTANYDDLLERALRAAGKRVALVVRDGDLPFMRRGSDVVNLVKLYGDLNQPDTLVLARQQYERFFLDRPQMLKLLETELTRSDVLYLGWSHTDPHFNLIFGELLSRFDSMMRPGYAAMFDLPAARAEELRRKQIHLAALPPGTDHTAQLAAWLTNLLPPASAPADPLPTRQPATPPSPAVAQPGPALALSDRTRLKPLHQLLTALFDDAADATRLAEQAGLERAAIEFDGKLINYWWNILATAHKHNLVAALVEEATDEIPARAAEIRQAYGVDQ